MNLLDAVAASLVRPPGATGPARLFKEVSDLEELVHRLEPVDPVECDDMGRAALVAAARARATSALAAAERAGLTPIALGDDRYPPWLREIVDPPSVLWVKGNVPPLSGASPLPAIAIVGSRQATPAGLEMGRMLAEGLAARGAAVVSGLARGVDGAAHEGALAGGGVTIGVLGCGADVVYPSEHRDLVARVAASGGVVSEFPPGTSPLPHHFPLRNRIIAGLSRAVIVIEAGEKSGSLITAKMAMEQGREVLVVPGNALSGRNRGSHALIKDGARLVESVDDVVAEMGLLPLGDAARVSENDADKLMIGNELSQRMAIGETYDADTLAGLTGWDVSLLLSELARLELAGAVRRSIGGWTRLAGRGRAGRQC